MTPENSSALPTFARTPSEASPQTTSDATAIEAGLRDAPGSSRGSSGWSPTEPTDDAVHGVPTDGPARHRGTTPRHGEAPLDAAQSFRPWPIQKPSGTRWPSGKNRPSASTGRRRARQPRAASPGTPRTAASRPTLRPAPARTSPGSRAANSTSPTTAWTAMSRPGAGTRWPCTSRANRATAAPSRTPSCSARCPRPPTPCWTWASPRATAWSSTCRSSPKPSSSPSPWPGSAPSIPWFSAASPPRR